MKVVRFVNSLSCIGGRAVRRERIEGSYTLRIFPGNLNTKEPLGCSTLITMSQEADLAGSHISASRPDASKDVLQSSVHTERI